MVLVLTILCVVFTTTLRGQDCANSRAQTDLEINAVRARLQTAGDLWRDGSGPGYTISPDNASPNGNQTNAIYAGALWVGAKGPDGEVRMAAPSYGRPRGRLDYYPGPLTNEGQTSTDTCARWDRFFSVERLELREFWFSGAISTNIAGWPAVGNPLFESIHGFPLPEQRDNRLAPFVDADGDGIYDPRRGDYPAVCGDFATWCVFNDSGTHRDSGIPNNTNTEIHLLAYGYEASQRNVIHRTTFYEYTIINQGTDTLSELYAGHWIDSDLGCSGNDRMNSLPGRDLFYVYNQAAVESVNCGNVQGYGSASPVNIFQILRSRGPSGVRTEGALNSVITLYQESLLPVTGLNFPTTPEAYYNVLSGLSTNGQPLARFGFGNQGRGSTTRYAFDGEATRAGTPWTYCAEQLPATDITHVSGTGPYTLAPGQRAEFTLAITTVFNVEYSGSCPQESDIEAAADEINMIYEDFCDGLRTVSTRPEPAVSTPLRVFPNPTRGVVDFELPAGTAIREIKITTAEGRLLLSQPASSHRSSVNLAAQNLPAGVYYYRLRTTEDQLISGRVVLLPD